MKDDCIQLKIDYMQVSNKDKCPCISITDRKTFDYSNIRNMYKEHKSGHGIQVDNPKQEKILLEMCDKISDILYNTVDKIKEINET